MKQKLFLKYLLCVGVVASVPVPSHAAGPPRGAKPARPSASETAGGGALSLDQAIRLALNHNPQLQASEARKAAAVGRSLQARAWPNPELELTTDDLPTRRGGFSQAKNMAGITQVVPFPGKKTADAQIGAADAATAAAEWRFHRAELVRAR